HLGDFQGPKDRRPVLVLGEVIVQLAAVDGDLAVAFHQAHPGHGGLAPAGAEVGVLCRFRHGLSPDITMEVGVFAAAGPGAGGWARRRFSAWSFAGAPGGCGAPCGARLPAEFVPACWPARRGPRLP